MSSNILGIEIMVSKNISIKKSVYDKLVKLKRQGESFSEVIERSLASTEPKQDLRRFASAWKDLPEEVFDCFNTVGSDIRKEFERRFETV